MLRLRQRADGRECCGREWSGACEAGRRGFIQNIYDLGDGEVDFPACHKVLKSVKYKGWICVDLDISRLGPMADYKRCDAYVVSKLEPIYL